MFPLPQVKFSSKLGWSYLLPTYMVIYKIIYVYI